MALTFGELLDLALKSSGTTERQAADWLAVSTRVLLEILHGVRQPPSVEQLRVFTREAHLTPEESEELYGQALLERTLRACQGVSSDGLARLGERLTEIYGRVPTGEPLP